MTKLEIYNIALDTLNIEPLTEEELDGGTDPIVKTLNRFFMTAVRKASREHNWSFLTEKYQLNQKDDLGELRGYKHSFKLPNTLFRLIYADGGDYIRLGDTIATNYYGNIYVINEYKDEDLNKYYIPTDYWELVAYGLAFFATPRLSSGDQKTQIVSSLYNTILSTLISNDVSSEIHRVDNLKDDEYEVEI